MRTTGPPDRRTTRALPLRRLVLRHRRLIAALLLCAAAGVGVEALLQDSNGTTPVMAAAMDVPVGTVLTKDHLVTRQLPPEVLPATAFVAVEPLLGQRVAAPLRKGDVLTDTALLGAGLLAGTPPGTVAVPLRPADESTVQLLAPGQLVDVVLTTGNGYDVAADTTVLASGLPVLWKSVAGAEQAWPGADPQAGLVVVAAPPEDAAALAGSASSGKVYLVLTGGG
ncbi:RcpC/CpaB family pilus assembly protein [Arthrobacter sp. H41]|uniref:RcpC/CpaB family pilus assembly protein n=1 Tax=Arthrobacter sp. H41 TaxID=1312978 RepID=UPI0004B07974|nr:RcpC/CpaB family pilus assembly protein [Arthrobacter sp. H41]